MVHRYGLCIVEHFTVGVQQLYAARPCRGPVLTKATLPTPPVHFVPG